jgi:DNA helicase-2/ATP-dependent DNA helicase PcrA
MRALNKKPLTTARLVDDDVVVRGFVEADEDQEAAHVAQDILERGIAPSDCAILSRATRLLHIVAGALNQTGIPAYVPVRKTEFESLEARVAFTMLRLANARHDAEVLRSACVAWNRFSDQELEVLDIEAEAALLGGDFLRAFLNASLSLELSPRAAGMASLARKLLLERLDVLSFVEKLLNTSGDGNDLLFIEEAETWKNLHNEQMTLHLYLQEMDLRSKAPTAPKAAVKCLTIHASKGLEFPHVYLVGMAEEMCPSWQSVKKGDLSREMEEERRNCFVAITRVQNSLTLTFAKSYRGWAKRPSRFLYEMGLITSDA